MALTKPDLCGSLALVMNAAMQDRPGNAPLAVQESRDFRSYHAFLRAARNFSEQQLLGQDRKSVV